MDMADFEESLKQEIPCEHCDQPAHWRSFGHIENDCGAGNGTPFPPYYKCTVCYMSWRERCITHIRDNGAVGCINCSQRFTTPEALSNYRKF